MRILPILFNSDMVRALLEGRKTVTRRIIRYSTSDIYKSACFHGRHEVMRMDADNLPQSLIDWYCKEVKHPPYEPGDILYVRETWTKLYYVDPDGYTHYDQPMYYYATDGTPDIILCDGDGFEEDDQRIRWRPSIHMPKEAARIFLKVTGVRAERLKDITEEQARAEGFGSRAEFLKAFLAMYPDCTEESWVWVIEFERVDKPEGWAI